MPHSLSFELLLQLGDKATPRMGPLPMAPRKRKKEEKKVIQRKRIKKEKNINIKE